MDIPRLMALFEKRIEGDDSLLHLATLRFRESGMGTELYAQTPAELNALLGFRPSANTPVIVHLDRKLNLLDRQSCKLIIDFANSFTGQIFGLVIHDQVDVRDRLDDYLTAVCDLDSRLSELPASPYLFIEYAVGLEPELFIKLFKNIDDLQHISACIDVGHIGIRQAKNAYAENFPNKDLSCITLNDANLPEKIDDVEFAVKSALPTVLHIIKELSKLGKHLHFHLHDGHPLLRVAPYGLSDHISFLDKVPIPFKYKGDRFLHTMFGPEGLSAIVTEAIKHIDTNLISFTLEIHPTDKRLPPGNGAHLFPHWKDLTNAEKMNNWLSVLKSNHQLLLDEINNALSIVQTKGQHYRNSLQL